MISTPYRDLQQALNEEEGWRPRWARHLEVRRGNHTIYTAHPEALLHDDLTDLTAIHERGWAIAIDSARLDRVRIKIWKGNNSEQ